MQKSPTIDRNVVTPIVSTIAAVTGNVDGLLKDADLLRLWSDSSVAVLPEDRVWLLFESAARRYGCPEIGLQAGGQLRIPDLGPFGLQLQNSLALYHCLNKYIQMVSRYSSHAKFWLEYQGDAYWFCRQGIDLISAGREYVEQFTIQLMIRIVQLAAGETWVPGFVRVQATSDKFYRECPIFNDTEIQTGQTATSIKISLVDGLAAITTDIDSPLVKQVKDLVARSSNHYRLDIDGIAGELGTSRRTLQRKLAETSSDWRGLVEQCRFRKAIGMLSQTDIKLIDLAHELGYTDQANFGRAFRKWTGVAPSLYREMGPF